MFKSNKKLFLFIVLLITGIVLTLHINGALAVSVTMDDGTVIDLEGLTDTERGSMLRYIEKINEAKKSTLGTTAADVILESAKDPAKLNEWRKLVTGTIRDIANDLGVGVNEFVKTPVGIGVAALIFYKVAGKDMMETVFDVAFAIPFWFMIMVVIAFTTRHFLGHKTEIMTITCRPNSLTDAKLKEDIKEVASGTQEVKVERPIRVCRYNWKSNDARVALGCFMVGIPIVATFVCFIIVFV